MLKKFLQVLGIIFFFFAVSPIVALSANPGLITTADEMMVFNRKENWYSILHQNSLFNTTISIGEAQPINGQGDNLYHVTYNFTKKYDSTYRLVDVISYMDDPTFSIKKKDNSDEINGSYVWDDNLKSWVLPNPLHTAEGDIDTSAGVRIYPKGDVVGILPLSILKNDESLIGERPTIDLGDLSSLPFDEVRTIEFDMYVESPFNDSNHLQSFVYYPRILVEYEFDAKITGTNPYDEVDLNLGDSVSFESQINLNSPMYITADTVWQVSKDGGQTFEDISATAINTNGSPNLSQKLEFVPTVWDEGNLYRVKIVPNDAKEGNPIYTEPAVLNFKKEYLVGGDVTIQYLDTEGNVIAQSVIKGGYIKDQYVSEKLEIEGYTFKEVQGDPSGMIGEEPQTITYIYTKTPEIGADVTIKYVDTKGNIISPTVIKSGKIGEKYVSEQLSINGYTFKEVQGNPIGEITKNPQTVTYIYKKNNSGSTGDSQSSNGSQNEGGSGNTSESNQLPNGSENSTGESNTTGNLQTSTDLNRPTGGSSIATSKSTTQSFDVLQKNDNHTNNKLPKTSDSQSNRVVLVGMILLSVTIYTLLLKQKKTY